MLRWWLQQNFALLRYRSSSSRLFISWRRAQCPLGLGWRGQLDNRNSSVRLLCVCTILNKAHFVSCSSSSFIFHLGTGQDRLTLCLSTLNGLRFGSKSILAGSMSMGDWRLPLLHSIHCGLMRPQKLGPERKIKKSGGGFEPGLTLWFAFLK